MLRALTFILVLCCCWSCAKDQPATVVNTPPGPNPVPPPSGPQRTYLALGDSYTIGQSVPENERFPAQTVSLLRRQGVNLADPVYIARTGWTTLNLQGAITTANLAPSYDIVSLLIGVNDQYQGSDTAAYAPRFTQLLEKAIALAGGKKERVFVLSIPDYGATPYVPASDKGRVGKEIDAFNSVNKRITESFGVSYTDITPSSRQALTNPALVAGDKLHPSGMEYSKWADMLAPKIRSALQ